MTPPNTCKDCIFFSYVYGCLNSKVAPQDQIYLPEYYKVRKCPYKKLKGEFIEP